MSINKYEDKSIIDTHRNSDFLFKIKKDDNKRQHSISEEKIIKSSIQSVLKQSTKIERRCAKKLDKKQIIEKDLKQEASRALEGKLNYKECRKLSNDILTKFSNCKKYVNINIPLNLTTPEHDFMVAYIREKELDKIITPLKKLKEEDFKSELKNYYSNNKSNAHILVSLYESKDVKKIFDSIDCHSTTTKNRLYELYTVCKPNVVVDMEMQELDDENFILMHEIDEYLSSFKENKTLSTDDAMVNITDDKLHQEIEQVRDENEKLNNDDASFIPKDPISQTEDSAQKKSI